MSYDWKVPYDYPSGYFDSNEHGFGALERGLENLAGQAVDWMSEAEVRGHAIPEGMALADAEIRDAWGPWTAGLEATEQEREFYDQLAQDQHDADLRAASNWYTDPDGYSHYYGDASSECRAYGNDSDADSS